MRYADIVADSIEHMIGLIDEKLPYITVFYKTYKNSSEPYNTNTNIAISKDKAKQLKTWLKSKEGCSTTISAQDFDEYFFNCSDEISKYLQITETLKHRRYVENSIFLIELHNVEGEFKCTK